MQIIHTLKIMTSASVFILTQSANATTNGACINLNALYDTYLAASSEELSFNESDMFSEAATTYESCSSYAASGFGQKTEYECYQDYQDEINKIPNKLSELAAATEAALQAYTDGYQLVMQGTATC